jgi:hypothetical protein
MEYTTVYHLYDELTMWANRLRELDMEFALLQQRGIRTKGQRETAEMIQLLRRQATEAIAQIQGQLRSRDQLDRTFASVSGL